MATDHLTRLTLPKATVQKIINEILSSETGLAFGKDARDLLIEMCVEYITLISSEANEISESEGKKTIESEHITKALEKLGFGEYNEAIEKVVEEHKEQLKVCFGLFFLQFERKLTRYRDERRKRINLSRVVCQRRNFSRYRRKLSGMLRNDMDDFLGSECSLSFFSRQTALHGWVVALLGFSRSLSCSEQLFGSLENNASFFLKFSSCMTSRIAF
jgi:histone H3/H4